MAKRPCTFRQSDVTRLLKAAAAAGVVVETISLTQDGKLEIVAKDGGKSEISDPKNQDDNPWDEVLS